MDRSRTYRKGAVLPTVIVVTLVILVMMLGLLMLWSQEMQLFARSQRLRQARADVESAATIYRLHPTDPAWALTGGCLLYDSLPQSRVFLRREMWGLYELLHIASADSLVSTCRIAGVEPDTVQTLFYADCRTAVTLAGNTCLQGELRMPQNGIAYGRVGSDFYRGEPIPQTMVKRASVRMPQPNAATVSRIRTLMEEIHSVGRQILPDTLVTMFCRDSTVVLYSDTPYVGNRTLQGRILLYGDSLHIDSTASIRHLLIVARKIVVGAGAHVAAQLFARDTVILEPRAVLEYPSGIHVEGYAELGEHAEVNGYVIVSDTVSRKKLSPSFRQARTARLRGMLYVDGVAQLQGVVAGRTIIKKAVYFSPQGYYKEMLYDFTLLRNPVTAHPLWLAASDTLHRKEALWVE